MKNNYLIIAFLFSSIMFGQINATFNNNGGLGDGLWSTASNWSTGAVPTPAGAGQLIIGADVNLDQSYIFSSTTADLRSGSKIVSGVGKITLTGAATTGLLCNSAFFNYNSNLEFNSSTAAIKTLQVNNASGNPQRQLILGPQSVLTLTTQGRVILQFDSKAVFRGKIEGAANLIFTGASEFDTTSDNTGFNGDFVYQNTGTTIVANTAGTGAFLKAGRKVQVNATTTSLTLNGANSMQGNLSIGSTHAFALNVNADQGAFGTINLGDGPLTINVAGPVTNLSFGDCSAISWSGTSDTGTIAITGFTPGEIRFGTTSSALTPQQLAKISADGVAAGNAPLGLDANGYLVLATTLSSDSFALESQKRISYPTVVDNQIYFSKPQSNVEIFDVTGHSILKVSNSNGIDSVTTSQLSSGIYMIVFDGSKVEKFIKK